MSLWTPRESPAPRAPRSSPASGVMVLGRKRPSSASTSPPKRDVVLFLVVETRAREILERIRDAARLDSEPGAGIAFQVPIEDAVGLDTQLPTILEELESEI